MVPAHRWARAARQVRAHVVGHTALQGGHTVLGGQPVQGNGLGQQHRQLPAVEVPAGGARRDGAGSAVPSPHPNTHTTQRGPGLGWRALWSGMHAEQWALRFPVFVSGTVSRRDWKQHVTEHVLGSELWAARQRRLLPSWALQPRLRSVPSLQVGKLFNFTKAYANHLGKGVTGSL